jgi:ribosomal protein L9
MRIFLAAAIVLSLAIPAQARGMKRGSEQTQQSGDKQKKSREEEKAYKDALRRIPNQKPADPWGKIR